MSPSPLVHVSPTAIRVFAGTLRHRRGGQEARLDASFRTIAIGVLSWPVPLVKARNDHFGISGASMMRKIRFANANVRTISRIVVHPQFRSLGLASLLVRHLCQTCPTRYVEALASMGRAHPLFEQAGMRRFEPARDDKPLYYLFDRHITNAEGRMRNAE